MRQRFKAAIMTPYESFDAIHLHVWSKLRSGVPSPLEASWLAGGAKMGTRSHHWLWLNKKQTDKSMNE